MSFERLFQATLAKLGAKIAPLVYLAHHAGRVLSVRSDGRADVTADDPEIDGESGLAPLQVLAGMPGARFDFTSGERVRFSAEGGSPAGQEVRLFEQDRSADRNAARRGDRVKLGTLTIANNPPPPPAPPSGLTITWIPEPSPYLQVPGAPAVATITGPIAIAPTPFTLIFEGWITSGSPEISLRHLPTESIP